MSQLLIDGASLTLADLQRFETERPQVLLDPADLIAQPCGRRAP